MLAGRSPPATRSMSTGARGIEGLQGGCTAAAGRLLGTRRLSGGGSGLGDGAQWLRRSVAFVRDFCRTTVDSGWPSSPRKRAPVDSGWPSSTRRRASVDSGWPSSTRRRASVDSGWLSSVDSGWHCYFQAQGEGRRSTVVGTRRSASVGLQTLL